MVIKLLIKSQYPQKNSQYNNSETFTNGNDTEIPKERYISPEEAKEITDELKLIQ